MSKLYQYSFMFNNRNALYLCLIMNKNYYLEELNEDIKVSAIMEGRDNKCPTKNHTT